MPPVLFNGRTRSGCHFSVPRRRGLAVPESPARTRHETRYRCPYTNAAGVASPSRGRLPGRAAVFTTLGLVAAGCATGEANEPEQTLQTLIAGRQTIVSSVEATGTVEPIRVIEVKSQAGRRGARPARRTRGQRRPGHAPRAHRPARRQQCACPGAGRSGRGRGPGRCRGTPARTDRGASRVRHRHRRGTGERDPVGCEREGFAGPRHDQPRTGRGQAGRRDAPRSDHRNRRGAHGGGGAGRHGDARPHRRHGADADGRSHRSPGAHARRRDGHRPARGGTAGRYHRGSISQPDLPGGRPQDRTAGGRRAERDHVRRAHAHLE